MRKLLVLSCLLGVLVSFNAYAGDGIGEVGKVLVGRSGNEVFIELLNPTINNFVCTSTHAHGYQYGLSLSANPAGKEILSTILMARAMNKKLFVQGAGACTMETNLEDVHYVILY